MLPQQSLPPFFASRTSDRDGEGGGPNREPKPEPRTDSTGAVAMFSASSKAKTSPAVYSLTRLRVRYFDKQLGENQPGRLHARNHVSYSWLSHDSSWNWTHLIAASANPKHPRLEGKRNFKLFWNMSLEKGKRKGKNHVDAAIVGHRNQQSHFTSLKKQLPTFCDDRAEI